MRRPEQGPPAAASLAQAERREDSVQDGIANVDAKDGASTGEGLSQIDEGRLQRRLSECRFSCDERPQERLEQPDLPDRRDDFFFQAEDGIRDLTVTGVQTCALPI